MPITSQDQADALVHIINEVRRDVGQQPWNTKSLMTTFLQHRTEPAPYRTIVQAAVAYAANPQHRTPAMLFDAGNWWPSSAPQGERTQLDPCEDHPEEPAHACKCCRADVLAGIRPKTHIGVHWDIPTT